MHALIISMIFAPVMYVAWLSLTKSSFGQAPVFVGFENYVKVLSDPYFWRSLRNTVVVVLIVVHLELLIGLGIALLFASGVPFRPFMLAAVLAPYAVSEISAVVMWRYLFDHDVGFATQFLAFLGLPDLEWSVNPTHGLILVALLSIWLHLPFTFVILYAARLAIPKDLYEAAGVDGASPFQQFKRITLPLLMPAMLIAMLFRYIFAFRLFSEIWLMTGGGPARQTEVLAVYLYLEAFRYNAFGEAAATGWLLVVASLILAMWYLRRLYKEMFATYA
ncbi:binding-protein-dependent transporters inner membrane component [Nitratireductor pacificus pht-3B]|uniref:Binding-protein-dependent transporters inner membrane component n=1 Tax=Nitratireductor pacificus pht-3B TaxID=391937 RepID=K2MM36_9HYPH|nr:binding-protein-dependent transporters inner membrane component [Nitratireductor pacificus pht-3B]